MKKLNRFNSSVTDADDDLVIHIKPKDIRSAVCRDHKKCVVARAILRQRSSTAKWVDVGNSRVLIGTGRASAKRYMLSPQARQQVRFFDENEGRFAPCSVELRAPRQTFTIGGRPGRPRGGKDKARSRQRQMPTR